MHDNSPTPIALPVLLKQKELRALLGLSKTRLWELEQTADPPPRVKNLNGAVRYDLADIQAWLARRKQPAPGKAA